MNYRPIGQSTLLASEIGFGCMSLPDDTKSATILLNKALHNGINYFDTADIYQEGRNETMLGKAFLSKRKDLLIATKVGNQPRPQGNGWNWNASKAYILTSVEASLRRLQTDYIDLYQLHGGTMEDPIDDTIEAFELLKKAGKIRHYGISSIRPAVIREYVNRSSIISVMMQYSLLDRRPEETSLPLLEEHGISLLARGTVAKGLLAGKPATDYLAHTASQVAHCAAIVEQHSNSNRSAAQTSTKFVLQSTVKGIVIMGIRTDEQLNDALSVSTAPDLTTEELAILQGSAPIHIYDAHR